MLQSTIRRRDGSGRQAGAPPACPAFSPLAATTFLLSAALAPAAWGQQNTTLQLPTFNFTTVSTTVSVPDGGTGLLGGIGRASEGSVTRGLPLLSKVPGLNRLTTNRGIGRDVGAMSMTVTPRIINLEEEELRQTGFSADGLSQWGGGGGMGGAGGAARGGAGIDPEVTRKAAFLTQNVSRRDEPAWPASAADSDLPSVAEIRRQNERAAAQRASEADEFFASAQRAESEGKAGAAKIYYQMALRRADPSRQAQILARLNALDGSPEREHTVPLANR